MGSICMCLCIGVVMKGVSCRVMVLIRSLLMKLTSTFCIPLENTRYAVEKEFIGKIFLLCVRVRKFFFVYFWVRGGGGY